MGRGEGGYTTGRGGASEVLPLQKGGGGAEKVLAMLKGGGGTKSFEVVLARESEVLAILKGGAKSLYPLQGGAKSFTLS